MKSLRNVSDSFWTADVLLIGLLAFLIGLGVTDPLDSLPVTFVLLTLLGLWTIHAVSVRRARGPRRRLR